MDTIKRKGFSFPIIILAVAIIATFLVVVFNKNIHVGTLPWQTPTPAPASIPAATSSGVFKPFASYRPVPEPPFEKLIFSVQLPTDVDSEHKANYLHITKFGPTQKQGTDFYDGINIWFYQKNLDGNTLEQVVDQDIENISPEITIIKAKQVLAINGYFGFSYTIDGPFGVYESKFLTNPYSKNKYVEIVIGVFDPTNKGFATEVSRILSTFNFLKD